MKNFKEIGEGELQYSYVAFTKLKNFSEKNDMIDGDTLSPMKRKLYYYNSKEKMLIYITHIYMKQNMERLEHHINMNSRFQKVNPNTNMYMNLNPLLLKRTSHHINHGVIYF